MFAGFLLCRKPLTAEANGSGPDSTSKPAPANTEPKPMDTSASAPASEPAAPAADSSGDKN